MPRQSNGKEERVLAGRICREGPVLYTVYLGEDAVNGSLYHPISRVCPPCARKHTQSHP
jgi:hypothetical protein